MKFFEKLPNPDKQFAVMAGISHASFQQKNYMLVYHILALLRAAGAGVSGLTIHDAELDRPRSAKSFAAKSTGTVGAARRCPEPYSFGRAVCAVRKPSFAAAARSLLCAATIMHCAGARSNAAQAAR